MATEKWFSGLYLWNTKNNGRRIHLLVSYETCTTPIRNRNLLREGFHVLPSAIAVSQLYDIGTSSANEDIVRKELHKI
jgi:hypothetical protein